MNDPTAPLYDFDGNGQFTVEQPELECPCAGVGWLGREWLDKREPECTCGAGDPANPYIRHDVSCDSVPCPFCPLEASLKYPPSYNPDVEHYHYRGCEHDVPRGEASDDTPNP